MTTRIHVCPRCGNPQSEGRFCSKCGLDLVKHASQSKTETPSEPTGTKRLAAWYGRSDWARWSLRRRITFVVIIVVVVLGIKAVLKGSAPSDGQSCVNASHSEIAAWVKSKESQIPFYVSTSEVQGTVESFCADAKTSYEPQDFSNELLHLAIEN